MKFFRNSIILIAGLIVFATILPSILWAMDFPHPSTYLPTNEKIMAEKSFFDDPRPVMKNMSHDKLLPKEMYNYLKCDIEEMSALWEEIVGFNAKDVVGKIAPEVTLGKYTWQDVQKNAGLQKLLPKFLLERIREGGPPHCSAIPEFEIIPTRQYYSSIHVAEVTKRNMGKTKLDENGYIIVETYDSGLPFPRPSGKFKGQQLLYNRVYNYADFGQNVFLADGVRGFDGQLRVDYEMNYHYKMQRLGARIFFAPKGFLNDRAAKRREHLGIQFIYHTPRDIAGQVWQSIQFQEPTKNNQDMIYLPSMRRIRKLSATDTQDPLPGLSTTYDDVGIMNQKMTPDRYPMTYKILEEREYLMVAPTDDGSETYRESDGARIGTKLERRPIYVLEVAEVDKNYIYSKRILYFDQEHMMILHGEYYDQKGRKYRSQSISWCWLPEFGVIGGFGGDYVYADHVDIHSEVDRSYLMLPADWSDREISLRNIMRDAR